MFTVIFRHKEQFSGLYGLISKVCGAIWRVRFIMLLWAGAMLMLALGNYHLQTGRVRVDEEGRLDMTGRPNQFSYSDVYHSLVATLLTVYNEEWEVLMFQEYLGVNPICVACALLTMFIGSTLFTSYFVGSLARELDLDELLPRSAEE